MMIRYAQFVRALTVVCVAGTAGPLMAQSTDNSRPPAAEVPTTAPSEESGVAAVAQRVGWLKLSGTLQDGPQALPRLIADQRQTFLAEVVAQHPSGTRWSDAITTETGVDAPAHGHQGAVMLSVRFSNFSPVCEEAVQVWSM